MSKKKLILAGNPNVGKSVIFSLLAGRYVTVSNYPQTTIEVTRGDGKIGGEEYEIIDTPGTNTLIPSSEDEQVTTGILISEKPDVLLQVADSKNLPRALNLSLQLAELGLPMTLCLNLADEASSRGISIDTSSLSDLMGVPVSLTVAVERRGLRELLDSVGSASVPTVKVEYPEKIEEAVGRIKNLLPPLDISGRGAAILLIEGNPVVREFIKDRFGDGVTGEIDGIISSLGSFFLKPLTEVISTARRNAVSRLISEVYTSAPAPRKFRKPVLTSLGLGLPVLGMVMAAVYWIVGYIGADVLVHLLEDDLFEDIINPFFERLFMDSFGPGLISDFFVGEYGLITMAITYSVALILPIIFTFFLVFSIMEDTGYLPRLAALLNNLFKKVGLSGKAVLPMVLGLGCTTMATMVTRILHTKRERVLATFLLALGIPCSAQLGVILGLSASVSWRVTAVWFLTVAVIMFLTGHMASRLLEGGGAPDFIMEIPPLRMPRVGNLVFKTLSRVKWYLKEVVPVFIVGTAILFVLDRLGTLVWLRTASAPVVQSWLNLPAEATDALIIGFFRRDFGAAGFYSLYESGMLDGLQVLTSLVTITLFIPCIANLLMIVKERGLKAAAGITLFIFPFALFIGGVLRIGLSALGLF